jgi:putative DNA methylase
MKCPVKVPKKLIEVALPLDAINAASVAEKQPFTKRHPRSLHIWWARRPFVATRAIIFAQLVNDPSWKWELEHPGEIPPNNIKASWAASRKRLFAILKEIANWENTTNEEVLDKARAEIRKSWREICELNKDHPQATELFNPEKLPQFHDPFAGGGALPLEAQRLGLEVCASDLNPVAVLINKAMIEIPPKFAGRPPVNPEARSSQDSWSKQWVGVRGLAEDVRYYGHWIREEAQKRVGHLYPPVEITVEMAMGRPDLEPAVGQKLNVIAWIWARTVKSPNPAFRHVDVPLASTFLISSKAGKEAWVVPIIEGDSYRFTVKVGKPPTKAKEGTKLARGANFRCLISGAPIEPSYIYSEANAGRMGSRLMAIVAEGARGRMYLAPTAEHELVPKKASPEWKPDVPMPENPRWFSPPLYGLKTYGDLFTPRQLAALTTFSDLVAAAREKVERDALLAGIGNDGISLNSGGTNARAYSEAISVYLGLAISRWADLNCAICTWNTTNNNIRAAFSRQAIPMTWDFVELSVFGPLANFDSILKSYNELVQNIPANMRGFAEQLDAQKPAKLRNCIISTDPPYYDNIGYADLSDFFYVWLRKAVRSVFPDLFATIAVPKAEELVATPYRHGSKEQAEAFFLRGMTQAMSQLREEAHPASVVTIYYAFKQSETSLAEGTTSTGWETFLDAVFKAGFSISGTWPIRTERQERLVGLDNNALASSIVLVCRGRPATAETVSRRGFLRELNQVLPEALDEMTRGSGDDRSPVAPVDLSQAIIGPGMAVFSKYSAVLEANGKPMSVQTALRLINRFLSEDDFDHDTQFCLHWFEQYGWKDGRFGDADTLARAKGTSVDGVKQSGVLFASGGIVRLLKWNEYTAGWDPADDDRLPVWEALHRLIQVFRTDGESGAGKMFAAGAVKAEPTRQLAYRLYTLSERTGRVEDARAYNEIVTSWSAIESAAAAAPEARQTDLFT